MLGGGCRGLSEESPRAASRRTQPVPAGSALATPQEPVRTAVQPLWKLVDERAKGCLGWRENQREHIVVMAGGGGVLLVLEQRLPCSPWRNQGGEMAAPEVN